VSDDNGARSQRPHPCREREALTAHQESELAQAERAVRHFRLLSRDRRQLARPLPCRAEQARVKLKRERDAAQRSLSARDVDVAVCSHVGGARGAHEPGAEGIQTSWCTHEGFRPLRCRTRQQPLHENWRP